MRPFNPEFNARLKKLLRENKRAIQYLSNRGITTESIEYFNLGLSAPYRSKRSGQEHADALVYPLRGSDGRFYNRYGYYDVPGVTRKPSKGAVGRAEKLSRITPPPLLGRALSLSARGRSTSGGTGRRSKARPLEMSCSSSARRAKQPSPKSGRSRNSGPDGRPYSSDSTVMRPENCSPPDWPR
jgi:hypothetical protein